MSKQPWALILGASSGFGEATALELARAGMNIFGVHLDRRDKLPHVAETDEEALEFAGTAHGQAVGLEAFHRRHKCRRGVARTRSDDRAVARGEEARRSLGLQRARQQKALPVATGLRAELFELVGVLDALGDDVEVEVLAELNE